VAKARRDDRQMEREQRVTPLELFFDLVVVFAITQVTGFLSRDPTWGGLLRGLLLLGALWWAWGAYAWLTNTLDPEEGAVRLAVFAAIGAMLVVSLAVPGAFGADGDLRRRLSRRPRPPSRPVRHRRSWRERWLDSAVRIAVALADQAKDVS